jgi:hypothetical protein
MRVGARDLDESLASRHNSAVMRSVLFLALIGSLAFGGCNRADDTEETDGKGIGGEGDGDGDGDMGGDPGDGDGDGDGDMGGDPGDGDGDMGGADGDGDGDGDGVGGETAAGGSPDPDPGVGGGGPESGGSTGDPPIVDEANVRLFTLPETMPRIDLTVSEASEASLRADLSTYVLGSFSFTDSEGTVGPWEIGVRGKGRAGSARSFDEKMAFKLDFNQVVREQKLFGLGKLNLNNMVQDPSCVHEWLAYQLFASQGVPVPRTGYARVYVNDVEFGVYLTIEATDDAGFLKRNFPSTRVLYEGEYGEDLFVGAEGEFDEDAGDDPLRIALSELTNLLAATPAQDTYELLADALDWDEVVATMATEIFVGHWDGYAPTRNNYFLHFDDEKRASLIPWGTDQTICLPARSLRGSGSSAFELLGRHRLPQRLFASAW